jgi:chitin synthase
VVDGRKIFNPRTRAMLAALGVYQEGVAKNVVNGKPVVRFVHPHDQCSALLKAPVIPDCTCV